ncbi:phosphoribosylglycinamide formyltransferase [Basidiobolus meristosporus CBS 931.73]|uniref:Phosphoribosylglycinamide formyltransferase n=1 Tax=Basidiobolus meristosporus CBS 931.73 TaxID=1314790 RepID=A0A1Y1YST5_9FUNG|nr:phosphoribosylglycinamide formyltransferase [Basidiobolus meristosporus CBS 931.73]|eukprot:ORY01092.1 phosphoribosylglycinamide formyltransferase [Basidiobolus meristosporus CBS 931.73]
MAPKIVILISGNGSNLQAIIDQVASGEIKAEISVVISNRTNAYGLTRASNASIPTEVFPLKPYKDAGKTRIEYDVDLAKKILTYKPDLIVLAGWMHILSAEFLQHFPENVINLHPALPGEFDGAHAIERAYQAFQEGKLTRTGVMVHKVIPAVDRGLPILTQEVPILPEDKLEDLEERIHLVEHKLLPLGIQKFLSELE